MDLIYRGIKYRSNRARVLNAAKKQQIIYCGKRIEVAASPKFPVFKYFKQLFSSSKLAVCHPVKFWYQHKSQHLETCWQLDVVKQFNCSWNLDIEQKQSLPNHPPIKLKYRGVTYYR